MVFQKRFEKKRPDYESMSRAELIEAMAEQITDTTMDLIQMVVKQKVKQNLEVILEYFDKDQKDD